MLRLRTVFDEAGVTVADVACREDIGTGLAEEHIATNTLVLVRRGFFEYHSDGRRLLVDPTLAYVMRPADEYHFDHPLPGGDDCTSISLDDAATAELWAGDTDLPGSTIAVTVAVDVQHRLLLSALRRGDAQDASECTIALAALLLEAAGHRRIASGRPSTAKAHRTIADGARQALAADIDTPLPSLARSLGVSRHHLVRVFRAQTGTTISQHRSGLRMRAAMERLAGGEKNLAEVAAGVGFADQAHLTRILRRETQLTPGMLRSMLSAH